MKMLNKYLLLFFVLGNHYCYADSFNPNKHISDNSDFNSGLIESEEYEIEVQNRLLHVLDVDDKAAEDIITLYPEILYKNYERNDVFLNTIIIKILETKNVGFIRKAIEIYPNFIQSVFGSELLAIAEESYFDMAHKIVSITSQHYSYYAQGLPRKACSLLQYGIIAERWDKIHYGIRLLVSNDIGTDVLAIKNICNRVLLTWKKHILNKWDLVKSHEKNMLKKMLKKDLEIGMYLLDIFKGHFNVPVNELEILTSIEFQSLHHTQSMNNIILTKEDINQIAQYLITMSPAEREMAIEFIIRSYMPQQLSKDDIEYNALCYHSDYPQLEKAND